MTLKCTMILGDCLEVMRTIASKDNALAFCDVPFGKTDNEWDVLIDLNYLWRELEQHVRTNGVFAWAATMPFGVDIIRSRRSLFRYDLVWTKTCATGFLNASKMPLRGHESVLVFYRSLPSYNPQKTIALKTSATVRRAPNGAKGNWRGKKAREIGRQRRPWSDDGTRHPTSVIKCTSLNKQKSTHPTQKPIALLDWLIRTYSNPGDNVLDPVSGSFTTCVSACLNGRNSIGIEKDPTYFEAGVERVRKTITDNSLDVKLEVRR